MVAVALPTALAKHEVAFDAVQGFDFRGAVIRAGMSGEGPRLQALGLIRGRLHCLVYSVETCLRAISLRKANNREKKVWDASK